MSEATKRSLNVSSLCHRRLHAQCAAPASCMCDCHDDAATEPESTPLAVVKAVVPDGAGLVWEDPPGRQGAGRPGSPVLSDEQRSILRAHPGKWARVREFKSPTAGSTLATRARKGKAYMDPTGFDFVGRRTEHGSALYARFVGQSSTTKGETP